MMIGEAIDNTQVKLIQPLIKQSADKSWLLRAKGVIQLGQIDDASVDGDIERLAVFGQIPCHNYVETGWHPGSDKA